jgi:hypothetical protein
MTITEMNAFAREDVFPSWWANSVQRYLSVGGLSFSLTKQDGTHVHVVAGPSDEAAAIAIDGKWRWSEATVSRAHPGGTAGTYDVFAVAIGNHIVSSPDPGTDETNYAFELRILKAGETPPIEAGVVDIYRKIGSVEWSGAEITRVDQTVPLAPTHAHRHATGQPDAIAPADINAAPEDGVGGNFAVAGILSTEQMLDLSASNHTAVAAGTHMGDKIALYSSGATGYGVGAQANRVVAYVPAGAAFAVREATNSGNASSGADAVVLYASGAIRSNGGPAVLLDARTASTDTQPYFAVDNKGKLSWGPGGGTATDTSLERSGIGALTLAGAMNINGAVKVTTGAVTSERAEGSTAFQTWVSGVSTITPWVVDTVGKIRWGAPTGALDTTLERSAAETLKLTGSLTVTKVATVEGELLHTGTKVGLFSTAGAVQSKGWGTPTPPGGTYKTALTYASTMNNIVDYVDTLATALKAYGILGI